jgi:hypothetical protein
VIAISTVIPPFTETRFAQAEINASVRTDPFVWPMPSTTSFAASTATANSIDEADSDPLVAYETLNERNWDGYGAEPISAETLRYARQLLSVMRALPRKGPRPLHAGRRERAGAAWDVTTRTNPTSGRTSVFLLALSCLLSPSGPRIRSASRARSTSKRNAPPLRRGESMCVWG